MESLASCSSISELYGKFALLGFSGRTSQAYYPLETMLSGSFSGSYTNSGMVSHGECLMLSSSEWRNGADVSFLSDALEGGELPQRYYLTAKACAGILRRAQRKGRPLPKALEDALKSVADRTRWQQGRRAQR